METIICRLLTRGLEHQAGSSESIPRTTLYATYIDLPLSLRSVLRPGKSILCPNPNLPCCVRGNSSDMGKHRVDLTTSPGAFPAAQRLVPISMTQNDERIISPMSGDVEQIAEKKIHVCVYGGGDVVNAPTSANHVDELNGAHITRLRGTGETLTMVLPTHGCGENPKDASLFTVPA